MGKWVHKLVDKSPTDLTAFCEGCGDTVKLDKWSLNCENAVKEKDKKKSKKQYEISKSGFWVYVVISASNEVIYVGMTENPYWRMKRHKQKSIWWDLSNKVEWHSCDSLEEATQLENFWINDLHPEFNIVGKRG